MPAEPLDQLGAAREDACLRAAEQLVAREAHDVGSRGKARRGGRLVTDRREGARAEIVDERQPGACRDRGELRESGLLGEADDPEVGLVHAQDHGRLGAERPLVVRHPGAVRRPDLDEPRSRAGEHVGNPEAVADLDQLPARDEHLAALGERGQGEHHGSGIVVHDERSLGAGDPLQQRGEMVLARPAGSRLEVVLEIGVASADLDDPVECGLGERRAAEVRVDQHPGRVEHAPQRRAAARCQLCERRLDEVAGITTFA